MNGLRHHLLLSSKRCEERSADRVTQDAFRFTHNLGQVDGQTCSLVLLVLYGFDSLLPADSSSTSLFLVDTYHCTASKVVLCQ